MMEDLLLMVICCFVLIVVLNLLIIIVGIVVIVGIEICELFDVDRFCIIVLVLFFGGLFEIVDIEVISKFEGVVVWVSGVKIICV